MLMYTGGRRYTLTNHETEKMVWSIERSRTSLNCAVEVEARPTISRSPSVETY